MSVITTVEIQEEKTKDRLLDVVSGLDLSVQRKIKRRAENKAMELSNKNRYQSIALKLLETMRQYFIALYQKDEYGYLNIDDITYMVKIASPWSIKNYRKYGLTRTEADILKYLLVEWQQGPSPVIYDNYRWYLNLYDFPDIKDSLQFLIDNRIDHVVVHRIINQINKKRREK